MDAKFYGLVLGILTMMMSGPAHARLAGIFTQLDCQTPVVSESPINSRDIQLTVKVIESLDYDTKQISVSVDYSGSASYDARTQKLSGNLKFSQNVTSKSAAPDLPKTLNLTDDAHESYLTQLLDANSEKSKTTYFPGKLITVNVLDSSAPGGYLQVKGVLQNSFRNATLAAGLYFVDQDGQYQGRPDSNFTQMSCNYAVHDLIK